MNSSLDLLHLLRIASFLSMLLKFLTPSWSSQIGGTLIAHWQVALPQKDKNWVSHYAHLRAAYDPIVFET